MIEFVEKEPWTNGDPCNERTYAPVVMVKDGVGYFVINRVVNDRDPSGFGKYEVEQSDREVERIKAMLLSNGGRYHKFNGFYDDPLEMIAEIENRQHTFTEPDDLFWEVKGTGKCAECVDFHGNLREVSAAFHYRIFDPELAREIKEAIKPIIERSRRQ